MPAAPGDLDGAIGVRGSDANEHLPSDGSAFDLGLPDPAATLPQESHSERKSLRPLPFPLIFSRSDHSIMRRFRETCYCSTVIVVRAPTDWPLAPGARVISVSLYWPGSTFLKDRLKATFTAPSSRGST